VTKVVMEHRGVDAVDDVVVYYAPPGVNDRGSLVDVDFYQVKYHLSMNGAVDHEVVIDPEWTGTKEPLLKRMADAWMSIRPVHPRARLTLVTNWPWDPRSPVAPMIRDGGRLDDKLIQATPGSAIGAIRREWQNACGLGNPDFSAFMGALRFSTSGVSSDDAEDWLRDRCQLAGLAPVEKSEEHSAYDDIGSRLLETGRTEQTPESLRALVEREKLLATPNPPYSSTLAIRSFSRYAHIPETDGACVVDLTDLFEGRKPRSDLVWSNLVPERLESVLPQLATLRDPICLALDTHLSIAWYVGHLLDSRLGRAVKLRQAVHGLGVQLWDLSESGRPAGADGWEIAMTRGDGSELAVVISVTHQALEDARHCIRELSLSVGLVVEARLPNPGHQAISGGGHARWLADELLRALSSEIARLKPARVHVFPACPVSLAFLLGQVGRGMGPVSIYEFDFGHSARKYHAGMSISMEERR